MRKLSYQECKTLKKEFENAIDSGILSGEDALEITRIIVEAEKREKEQPWKS